MVEVTTRDFTDEERAHLELQRINAAARGPYVQHSCGEGCVVLVFGFGGCVTLLALLTCWRDDPLPDAASLLLLLGPVLALLAWRWKETREQTAWQRAPTVAHLGQPKGPDVVTWRVVAHGAALLPAFDDEGDLWLFDVGDGQLLVLAGQEFDHVALDERWPTTEFTIESYPTTRIVPAGEELRPVLDLDEQHADTRELYKAHDLAWRLYDTPALLPGRLETCLADLVAWGRTAPKVED